MSGTPEPWFATTTIDQTTCRGSTGKIVVADPMAVRKSSAAYRRRIMGAPPVDLLEMCGDFPDGQPPGRTARGRSGRSRPDAGSFRLARSPARTSRPDPGAPIRPSARRVARWDRVVRAGTYQGRAGGRRASGREPTTPRSVNNSFGFMVACAATGCTTRSKEESSC
jgi:hypothetical protein